MLLVKLKNGELFHAISLDSGSDSINESRIIVKSNTIPEASEIRLGHIYQYAGITNTTYTHGHIYECGTKSHYSATVTFTPDTISCDGDDFSAFLESITDRGGEITHGSMVYAANADLWVFTGKDENNTTVVSYQVYTQDFEDVGFVFTGEFSDGDEVDFVCTVTEIPYYFWERINLQPYMPMGALIQIPTGSSHYIPIGCSIANGTEYNIADYPNLFNDYFATGLIRTVSYASYADSISSKGYCYAFGINDNTTKFKVPTIPDTTEGLRTYIVIN